MTVRRQLIAATLALVLVATTGTTGAAADPTAHPTKGSTPTETITLITGDRIDLPATGRPVPHPGPGRAGIQFLTTKDGTNTFVLPYDALPLVAAGRLDRRLFNITKLAALGYSDQARRDIPLIITGTNAKLSAAGTHELKSLSAVALHQPKTQAAEFWKSVKGAAKTTLVAGVNKIWLDGKVKATLDRSVPQIGAPTAWQAGYTGADTTVAVLDTGIDTAHADLSDAVARSEDFTGSEFGADDHFGHGTHVASTITGSGAASGGKYKGVAPDTKLLNGKVLDDHGNGDESWALAGMEWAVAQGADVVNLSLGSEFPTDGTSPMDQAVNRLTAESGTLFVVAAGNDGPGSQTVSSPAAADAALAVGAVDKSDRLADFSSRGPRQGDAGIKPDITAPGVGIVAARAKYATVGTPAGPEYLQLDGTSMAAPHVAGAAAILAGQHPGWKAGELKAALMDSAEPNGALTIYQEGAGRVDVARATAQQVRTDAGSIDLGEALWPHNDDKPVQRTVTYRNDGDQPVSLALSTDAIRNPQGEPSPAGMFTVSAERLTVPAHGSAAVRLTANPAIDGPAGTYKGALVAAAGATRVRTIIALYREVESYDVTVKTLGRDGKPAPLGHFMIVNVEQPGFKVRDGAPESFVVRLPKSRYYYEGFQERVVSEEPYSSRLDYFFEPDFAVTKDTVVTLDARDTVPLVLRTDHPEADRAGLQIESWRDTPWAGKAAVGSGSDGIELFPHDDDRRVRPSRTSALSAYKFSAGALLAKLDGHGGWTGSPYQYHLKWAQDGMVPGTLDRLFRDRELAELRTTVAAQTPGEVIQKDVAGVTTPGKVTDWYSPGFEFAPGTLTQWSDDGQLLSQSAVAPKYFEKPGPAGTERWNVGPFMPALNPDDGSRREGDRLTVDLWMYSDQKLDHVGDSATDSSSARLLRDGVEVASSESAGYLDAGVPADASTYRLESTAARSNSPYTTRQSGAWTFRSGRTAGETRLPLMMLRFAPKLDELNQAPAGCTYAVPVAVQLQRGRRTGSWPR